MKYRIQVQQVFGGDWASMDEATKHAEWLQKDDVKPRSRIEALAALVAQANLYRNGAPHRLVAIQPNGEVRVVETITRGVAFFPAAVAEAVATPTFDVGVIVVAKTEGVFYETNAVGEVLAVSGDGRMTVRFSRGVKHGVRREQLVTADNFELRCGENTLVGM